MNTYVRSLALVIALPLLPHVAGAQAVEVDPKLPEYKPVAGRLGQHQERRLRHDEQPDDALGRGLQEASTRTSTIEIEGKGSSTAPPALIEGTAHFGPMSRDDEGRGDRRVREEVRLQADRAPRRSIDMLAVYVHKDNPIECLTLQQVDAIFSKTRKGGARRRTSAPGATSASPATGPTSRSASTAATRPRAPTATSRSTRSSRATSRTRSRSSRAARPSCRASPATSTRIGYSGIGYKTADVRAVPLAADAEGEASSRPTADNAYSGEYPLARFLYVYVNYKPGTRARPAARASSSATSSARQGQEVVVKDGYFPVTADDRGRRRWQSVGPRRRQRRRARRAERADRLRAAIRRSPLTPEPSLPTGRRDASRHRRPRSAARRAVRVADAARAC